MISLGVLHLNPKPSQMFLPPVPTDTPSSLVLNQNKLNPPENRNCTR